MDARVIVCVWICDRVGVVCAMEGRNKEGISYSYTIDIFCSKAPVFKTEHDRGDRGRAREIKKGK